MEKSITLKALKLNLTQGWEISKLSFLIQTRVFLYLTV